MIKVDESDPVGELEPSFPYRDITIRRGVDMKEHYELQSEIGRGKFGTVFKCREKATGLMLAAKFVGIVQKQDRRNAEREVEIMSELQHPRLIQLYDAFEANNAMCFILELVEGGELFDRVIGDDFVLTEKAVTIFMRQICEGVQFIHSKNILHLDLKPENILCLTKTGNRIKIIDFGLARKFNPENKLQVLFGTPEFVAPEVVNFDAIGFGTDMWSIGVICYVLLSGLSPFMGETDVETMANVTIAQYDFDDEAFDSISNDAKDFIKKLLVKDHKSRPTATECLSHRWLQKKKPKKMVRKNSSKKLLVKQQLHEEEKTKSSSSSEAVPCSGGGGGGGVVDVPQLLVPLDATKENLKEFCNKSRSQSPVEIAAVSPCSVAQQRIKKDANKTCSEPGNRDASAAVETRGNKACDKISGGLPQTPTSGPQQVQIASESAGNKVCDKISGGLPQTPTSGPQQVQIASESAGNKVCDKISGGLPQTPTSGPQQVQIASESAGNKVCDKISGGLPQTPTSGPQQVQIASESAGNKVCDKISGGLPQTPTSGPQQVQIASESAGNKVCDKISGGLPQTPTSGPQQVQIASESAGNKVCDKISGGSPQTSAPGPQVTVSQESVRKPAADVAETAARSQRTVHVTTTTNSYRRASDVSYMFSSFRSTATVSSDFLGAELQGLSERLQGLQSCVFDRGDAADRPAEPSSTAAESLHKLLLNRQQLTAAAMHADRRPKFRMSPMNRDVPFGSPPPASNLLYYMTASSSCRSAPHSKRASPEHDTTSAKEMLLKLFYRGGDKTVEPKLST